LPGVAYPGVRDNRSTINTKTGYDDDEIRSNINHLWYTESTSNLHLPALALLQNV